MKTSEKEALLNKISNLSRELDAAPNSRMHTPWWNDRIRKLQRLWKQVENR